MHMTADSRHPSLSVLDKPFAVMGIVNVTPDSFSDGGLYADPDSAIRHALRLAEQGADVLDIGGESTRPAAHPVSQEEECRRVLPVIEAIAARSLVPLSIDTTKAAVARMALDAGAAWINDISATRFDSGMATLAAERRCPLVLMHSRKTPGTMQVDPIYNDVVAEVAAELNERITYCIGCGVPRENIIIDPGIGFAKRFEDNIQLLKNIHALHALGFPLLLGTSRKSFIGQITANSPGERLAGTLASIASAFARGVKFFRVHDVGETVDFLKVLSAL
jgi:dihydropteroate synthase